MGLAFKQETDDIRNAPSIFLIKALLRENASLSLYDPQAMPNMRGLFPEKAPEIVYADSPYEAIKDANAALFVTEWDEFKQLDFEKIRNLMANPIIIDGRNLLDPQRIRKLGFEYNSIGRK